MDALSTDDRAPRSLAGHAANSSAVFVVNNTVDATHMHARARARGRSTPPRSEGGGGDSNDEAAAAAEAAADTIGCASARAPIAA